MDRRTLLALVLMALVLVITPILFPSAKKTATPLADSVNALRAADSLKAASSSVATTKAATQNAAASVPPAAAAPAPTVSALPATVSGAATTAPRAMVPESTVVVATPNAEFVLQNPGGTLASVTLPAYRTLLPGRKDTMRFIQPRGPLLHYRLALGADTVALDT